MGDKLKLTSLTSIAFNHTRSLKIMDNLQLKQQAHLLHKEKVTRYKVNKLTPRTVKQHQIHDHNDEHDMHLIYSLNA